MFITQLVYWGGCKCFKNLEPFDYWAFMDPEILIAVIAIIS